MVHVFISFIRILVWIKGKKIRKGWTFGASDRVFFVECVDFGQDGVIFGDHVRTLEDKGDDC